MSYQGNPPTDDEKNQYSKADKFISKLKSYPKFEIRLGRLQKNEHGYSQKGVDVMLTVDLLRMCWNKQIDKAIIIAGDSDFVPAVKAAKDVGIITVLYYSNELGINSDLFDVFDERKIIDGTLIEECKRID